MAEDCRVLLFDIDGTLIVTGGAGATSWRPACTAEQSWERTLLNLLRAVANALEDRAARFADATAIHQLRAVECTLGRTALIPRRRSAVGG